MSETQSTNIPETPTTNVSGSNVSNEFDTSHNAVVALLAVVNFVLIAFFFKNFPNVKVAPNFSENATNLVGMLLIVTALVERSTAALSGATIGASLANARSQFESISNRPAQSNVGGSNDKTPNDEKEKMVGLQTSIAEMEAKDQKGRIIASFAFGLLISAAGVRTLGNLLSTPNFSWQPALFHSVDIVLTAGLIAGGTHGLNRILTVIKTQYPRAK